MCQRVHHDSQVYKKEEGQNGVRIPGNRTSRKKMSKKKQFKGYQM